jgi:hypothetical protein
MHSSVCSGLVSVKSASSGWTDVILLLLLVYTCAASVGEPLYGPDLAAWNDRLLLSNLPECCATLAVMITWW